MIGDLTGAPQPIVIKLYSDDVDALKQWAPRVADTIGSEEDVEDEMRYLLETLRPSRDAM